MKTPGGWLGARRVSPYGGLDTHEPQEPPAAGVPPNHKDLPMRINRRFLYWGALLLVIGGVLVVADLGAIDATVLTDVLRLWPLAIVAIGLSVVLRRTQLALPALLVAAIIPGLVVGSAFAIVPRVADACGIRNEAVAVVTQEGSLDEAGMVSVRHGCGVLRVTTASGRAWRLDSRTVGSGRPVVDESGRALSINIPSGARWNPFSLGRNGWDLTLPTTEIRDLSFAIFAADGRIELPNAQVGRLDLKVNAARAIVDLTDAEVGALDADVNAAQLVVTLSGDDDLAAAFDIGASDLRICAPPELGLRVSSGGTAESFEVDGFEQSGGVWLSPAYRSADHRADLTIDTAFGAVEINPNGGCK